LSSDDDDDDAHLPEHDALADQDVLAADDARGTGTTSAEATVPGLARAGLPGTIRPLAADQVPTIPPSGVRSQKRMCLTMKRSDPSPRANQVMS
jgi:hypothetical protein